MSKLYMEMKNAVIFLGFAELVAYRIVIFYRRILLRARGEKFSRHFSFFTFRRIDEKPHLFAKTVHSHLSFCG